MSGPIVRKYGFPNFEKIFGEREIKHGSEPAGPAGGSTGAMPEAGTEAVKLDPGPIKPADPRAPGDKP